MKTLAIFIVVICALSSPACAGWISIYSDVTLSSCALSDAAPGLVNIYVADFGWDGSTGSRFRIVASPGFTGTWLAETSPFTTIGTSPTDFSVGYANCMVGHFVILTMTYQMFGTSTCSTLSIAPAVGFPEVYCTYCMGLTPCYGFDSLHVNCQEGNRCNNPVAVESMTWGKVKALYRN